MYELFVLSLLMRYPLHAYLMAKIANDTIGPWEKLSQGTLSTLLKKLEKDGYVKVAASEKASVHKRQSKAYEITDAGRERFVQLMMDTKSSLGSYTKLFHIKSLYLDYLPYKDQVYLVNHYLTYCETGLHHMQVEMQDYLSDKSKQDVNSGHFNNSVPELMQLFCDQWRLEIDWASKLREQLQLTSQSSQ